MTTATPGTTRACPATLGQHLDGLTVIPDDPRVPGHPGPPLFRPVVGGAVLPCSYWDSLSRGHVNAVAVLAGNNRDKSGVLINGTISLSDYRSYVRTTFGDLADEALLRYPAADDRSATASYNALLRDGMRISTHLWAEEYHRHVDQPVRTYFWTRTPPVGANQPPFQRGAFHGSEIDYLFSNLTTERHPYAEEDAAVAATMTAVVSSYVLTGTPSASGLPSWPDTRDADQVMELGSVLVPTPVADPGRIEIYRCHFASQQPW